MAEVTIIGIDPAKRVFQMHGAAADGAVVFRRRVSRERLLPLLTTWPRCVVAMEACGTAHDWGREVEKLGHTVRLIPPVYVKPFVKRQKNDAADAEAIGLCGVAADHAVRGREVPGAAGPSDAVPDTAPSRAAANAAGQRAPGPPRRARGGRRAGAGAPEAAGRRDRPVRPRRCP